MTIFTLVSLLLLLGFTGIGFAAAVTAFKDKYVMLLCGLIVVGPILWTIGATRLGRPGCTWARIFYDEAKLAKSSARYPNAIMYQATRPTHRITPPPEVRWAIGLLSIAGAGLVFPRTGTPTTLLLAFLLGILAAFMLLLWYGHKRAHTVTLSSAVVVAALLLTTVLGAPNAARTLLGLTLAIFALCAFVLLRRRAARDYAETDYYRQTA